LYLTGNKYRLNYTEQKLNAAYSENSIKYITSPCSENRNFCDIQAGDRTAATVFENKINPCVDREMEVWMESGRDFRTVAMSGRRKVGGTSGQ
jgi:hypothetical protein